jgi:hypothetical protein
MPTGTPTRVTAAFSPEAIRQAIRGRAQIPADMLQEALAVAKRKLTATEIKYFSHQGLVNDKREVEAHQIQLKAAELILQMSDLLARGQAKPSEPKVVLTIDPRTGVTRIIIGDDAPEEQPEIIDVIATVETEEPREAMPLEEQEVQNEVVEDDGFEHIKAKRGELDPAVRLALFGEAK